MGERQAGSRGQRSTARSLAATLDDWQAWRAVFNQACFSLALFQLTMVAILGE